MAQHFRNRVPQRHRDGSVNGLLKRLHKAEALHKAGFISQAVPIYRAILTERPDFAPAIYLSGIAAYQEREYRFAELLLKRVIAMAPKFADAHYNLALTLQEMGEMEQAFRWYRSSLEINKDNAPAWVNAGTTLLALGEHEQAIEFFNQAMTCTTPASENLYNRGLANVLIGKWLEGWDDLEHRWDAISFRAEYTRDLKKPQWDGQPTTEPLLLWSEQGFGDTIMMLRYLPLLVERCPNVTFEVQPQLVRTVKAYVPDLNVIANGDPIPSFSYHLPTMSLPHRFATTPDNVPPLHLEPWKGVDRRPERTVGICWSGTAKHRNDARRSIPLSAFWPLFDLPIAWQALQLERLDGLAETPVQPLPATIGDFADTAAVIQELDLVITVDTAIAHLAGALNKPTLLLLSAWPDYRWGLESDKTPWYPTMKLYRQAKVGDWMPVIMRLRKDLDVRVR